MNDGKTLSIDELAVGVWRHKLLALAIAGAVIVLGALYAAFWPRTYAATTVLRIEAQTLPEGYVQSTVTERVEQRLATVRHELLSRPILGAVIEELDLYPDLRKKRGIDAALDAMRARLEVRVEGENAFAVTYRAGSPEAAARVVTRLPEVYVEHARAERALDAARVAAIFTDELAKLEPDVAAVERRLAEFKAKHAGELPEVLEANLRQLDRLAGLTETSLTALADAQRRRTALARVGVESSVAAGRAATAADEAERALAGVQAHFKEPHPEVAAAERARDEARQRYRDAAAKAMEGDNEFTRLDGEIRWLAETARSYQGRMDEYLKRIDATPAVGAEMGGLAREYEGLRTKYQSLLSRKIEADLAEDLERRQKSSLFRVVEPPLLPSRAESPDPIQALGVALFAGLGLGLAAAAYRASRDTSIRSLAEARQRLGLPVLAAIPELGRRGARGNR
jgi:polysaccharide chain length determinant protein (PEP-CTERM system associated)